MEIFLKKCAMCPRECGANRLTGQEGFCGAGEKIEVYASHLHFGEEPPISGTRGSGTIFLSHCNMRCVYCQNYRLSQAEHGRESEIDEFVDLMISLQEQKAHNINLVTPTHYAAHIAKAIPKARKKGLKIPMVYNSGGYEKAGILRLLDGLVDIYLVDMRYGDNSSASNYSFCKDYVEVNRKSVKEMHKQAGNLQLSEGGIGKKGIIIRHLILPADSSGTENVLRFISEYLGNNTYVSLMSQYYPAYKAGSYARISRKIIRDEYKRALALLHKYKLKNGWIQEYMGGSVDPDFAGTNIKPGR